ncbi:MAG: META domain-containing protein [Niabella sp.]
MKQNLLTLALISLVFLQACSSGKAVTKKDTIWVSGFKTITPNGAGKSLNYVISRNANTDVSNWQNFYAPIKGFDFEEGYMKKIRIKETHLDKSKVPADASSIQYELVKELEKKQDSRSLLNGSWVLAKIDNHPVNRKVVLPTLIIDLESLRASGNDGCNNYVSSISALSTTQISFGTMGATKKACIQPNIANEYYRAVEMIKRFKVAGNELTLQNQQGEPVLTFTRKDMLKEIEGSWMAVRINKQPLNKMNPSPVLTINLTDNIISGNNSCNDYSGKVKQASEGVLIFENIVATEKMCLKNNVADKYSKAINEAVAFTFDGKMLLILDRNQNELVAYLRK